MAITLSAQHCPPLRKSHEYLRGQWKHPHAQVCGWKLGTHVTVDIVSLHDDFDENHYDIAFFGGGQDFEQSIIADDLPAKKRALTTTSKTTV